MTPHVTEGPQVGPLHPECPDVARLGPTRADGALRGRAARVAAEAAAHRDTWTRGMSRRKFLARVGIGGAAALTAPLVTARA